MLGFFRKLKHPWKWAVYGKHPVSKDYFTKGETVPILKAFSAWVEKGYQSLKNDTPRSSFNAIRFWIKGPNNDLILGTIHDSSDTIGRKFPLLFIGTGAFNGWEKNWEELPDACEKTYSRIEYLACKRYETLKNMESDLRTIPPPQKNDTETNFGKENRGNGHHEHLTGYKPQLEELSKTGSTLFQIKTDPETDIDILSETIHYLIKNHLGSTVPSSLFTIISSEKLKIIPFTRPLANEDFLFLHEAAR